MNRIFACYFNLYSPRPHPVKKRLSKCADIQARMREGELPPYSPQDARYGARRNHGLHTSISYVYNSKSFRDAWLALSKQKRSARKMLAELLGVPPRRKCW